MPMMPLMALLFGCLWIWCGYVAACRLMPGSPVAVRWTAAFVVVAWLLCASFLLTASLRVFAWPAGLMLWIAAAAAAHVWAARARDPLQRLRDDVSAAAAWWRALGLRVRIVAGIGSAIAAARVCRALLMPPLAVDGLTYHLVKAAAWIQARGFTSTAGPDAARYYDWFPPYGDIVWAWWMLGARSDAFLPLVGAAIWMAAATGTYAAARAFGATAERATLAAAALVFTPAFAGFVTSSYVDNLVVALAVAGLLFLARAFAARGSADAVVAAGAFAVLAGVRINFLPIAAIGIACAAWNTVRRSAAAIALGVGLVAVVPYAHAWIATGSPLYPLTIRVGGRPLFPGNEELEWLLRATWMAPEVVQAARTGILGILFFPWRGPYSEYLGLGPGPLALLAALPISIAAALRSRCRAATLFAAAMAAIAVASVFSADSLALRVFFAPVLGRFLTVAVAVAAILVAASPSRLASGLLLVCAAGGVASGWPGGWAAVDVLAIQAWLPWFVGGVGGAWAIAHMLPRGRTPIAATAVVIVFAGAAHVRDRFRYQYYEAAAAGRVYELHTLDQVPASSWPLWRYLDRAAPLTLAVSAGWDGIGHNVYRLPLAGGRLQNRLVYVPISRDGSIGDYRVDAAAAQTRSCDAWLRRVIASEADYLVLLPPLPPENAWARSLPRWLVPEFDAGGGGAVAYRIDRALTLEPAAVSCIDGE